MISYEPLWELMKRRGVSTYTLQVKGGISSSTVRRLKAGESVSTNTRETLCRLFDCRIEDVAVYIPEQKE